MWPRRREELSMRRPALALVMLLGVVGASTQLGSTSGNSLPAETTAVQRSTTVSGGTLISMGYTVTGDSIVSVQPTLQGVGLLPTVTGLLGKSVTVRFGSSPAVTCSVTASTLINAVTRLAEATYSCGGLLEDADRPRPLQITAS